jgi:ribosomal protein S12 methylthiotransferase accessory factor YcaO
MTACIHYAYYATTSLGLKLTPPMRLAELAATAAKSVGAWIGEPRLATLPTQCPISIFVCPVRLPAGCNPPAVMKRRIGAGSALDAATARDLCLLEGIERYSLQFRAGDPESLASVAMPGARKTSRPIGRLRLGHEVHSVTDSRGCSVGRDLTDAALRGLLELAEHDALEIWRASPDLFHEVTPSGLDPALDGLLAWLEANRFRSILFEHRHKSGAIAYVGICSGAAGDRPATGSAAGLDGRRAAIHACVESVVAWFNFSEIAKSPSRIDDLPPDDRLDVETYLGIARMPEFPPGAALRPASIANTMQAEPETAFRQMMEFWGIDLAVFDLSRPETGIVTARVARLTG